MKSSRLRLKWDRLGADETRRLQASALRRYLADKILPFSAYYRELFATAGIEASDIRSLEDLRRIPLSSKRDLIPTEEHPDRARDFVLIPDEAGLARRPSTILRAILLGKNRVKRELAAEFRPILMTSTTGRSAEPVPFLYTQHDVDVLTESGRRLMEICASRPEYRHMNLFPFAPHLAFWQAHYAGIGFNVFNLSTGGGKAMGTVANVRLMKKIQPEALIGMPTFVYHLLDTAVEEKASCPGLRKIVLGGEKVPTGMRRKLRALCAELGSSKVDILATYGLTEAKMAFPECPPVEADSPTGYHLYPDLGIVEIIDPESGDPVPDNHAGEIVYSALDSRGSAVIRYRTGDLIDGGITREPCPACGRSVPRLLGKISRVSSIRRLRIDKIKGNLVNFNDLEHILDDMNELGAWQIELRKTNDDPLQCDEIVVHAHKTGPTSDDEISRAIESRFRTATEIRPNAIIFHDAADMRTRQGVGDEIKEKRFVDNRPASAESDDTAPEPLSTSSI